jgi:hypothetical protein
MNYEIYLNLLTPAADGCFINFWNFLPGAKTKFYRYFCRNDFEVGINTENLRFDKENLSTPASFAVKL